MVITPLIICILTALRRYKFMKRAQIQVLFMPKDKDGSNCREVLRKMRHAGLIKCHKPPQNSSAPVVYTLTDSGGSTLAAHTNDPKHFLDCEPNTRAWVNFQHYLCVTDLFIMLDAAIATQAYVQMPQLFFEHDIINPDETDPDKRYRLYTKISDKVVCIPDAAGEIIVQKYSRAVYWEYERGTDSPTRVAAKKHGYASFLQSKKFSLHFPSAKDARVIYVCPAPTWRDSLRRAMKFKPCSEMYLFCSVTDLTKESFLHSPVFFTVKDDQPKAFVKAPAGTPVITPPPMLAQGTEGGTENVL